MGKPGFASERQGDEHEGFASLVGGFGISHSTLGVQAAANSGSCGAAPLHGRSVIGVASRRAAKVVVEGSNDLHRLADPDGRAC